MLNKLHHRLQDFVKDNWKGNFTEIQQQAFDPIFNGESCIIEAPTSGGKTEAVLFPLLSRIAADKKPGVNVLYIAPLKALLNDISLRAELYAERCYLKAFKWHGDVNQGEKIKQMSVPAQVLLTTPESIEAILLRKANWKETFSNLQAIVIDEAHYFALTERGSHLISLLERIEHEIDTRPQRIALTATVGNPENLLRWLMSNRKGGIRIRVIGGQEKNKDFKINYINNLSDNIYDRLYSLLPNKKSIVFQNSRALTEDTAANINERNTSRNSVKVATHHSSVSKRLREDAEKLIKLKTETSLNAIISTSTLELGIDIGPLDQVIQIGSLNSSGSFLQRVGRTGRREGRPQFFRGLCSSDEELLLLTACVNLGLHKVSENILFPEKAFHIMAHQLICLSLQKHGVKIIEAWEILSKAACFSSISRIKFETLIDYMIEKDFLRKLEDEILIVGIETENEFLKANWKRLFAIFDTGPMYNVVDGRKIIGTLDCGFVRMQKVPFLFVLGGQEWHCFKVNHETQQVSVERNKTGTAPKWKAIGNHDTPFEVAQEVGRMLMSKESFAFLDNSAAVALTRQREAYGRIGWDRKNWIIDNTEPPMLYIWTFAGDKINRAIAKLLTPFGKKPPGNDYQMIWIELEENKPSPAEEIISFLDKLKSKTEEQLEEEISEYIDVVWFSKFSACLPNSLARETIREKSFDLNGLLREFKRLGLLNKMILPLNSPKLI